ncbi:lipopolysaccharide biosynthesis protein [Marichromatium bheemlicum]|uniref:Lipopolysaccharide biosynthesis protein n=1 Tax=Marichromatium bheemlicum TaxID=365339 RepID=A0ABX1IBZ6_9GAMM|nr:polysaccharide biosynthesis C-terminal domain-containing protein [Marichromatium bheemlicum]NKN33895.1 lipopolysaccharide biosynthesis protein [Marichromatium bheemlicum]
MEPRRADFSTTLARYLSSKITRQLIGAITAFLRPRLLTPELFGVWTLLKLIPQYASYAHLGARTTLRVYYPWHIARGEQARAETLVSGAILTTLLLDLLVAAALILIALHDGQGDALRLGLVAMAGVVLLQAWHHTAFAALKARHRFDLIGRANYLESVLLLATTLALLPTFGFYGVLWSLLITEASVGLLLWHQAGIVPRWPRRALRLGGEMIRRGWPIMSLELAMMLVVTADRVMAWVLLGASALGHYGVAVMIIGFLRNIPGTAREILEPRLMGELAASDHDQLLREHLLRPALNAAFLMPLLIGPVALATPLAIDLLLPRYQEAIVPTQILACGVHFLALALVLRSLVVAFEQQRRAARLTPAVLAAEVLVAWLAVELGWGLEGIATASVFGLALLFILFRHTLRPQLARLGHDERRQLDWVWPLFALNATLIWALSLLPLGHGPVATALRILVHVTLFLLLHRLTRTRLALLSPLPWRRLLRLRR